MNYNITYNGKEYNKKDYENGFLVVDGVLVNVSDKAVKRDAIVLPEGIKTISGEAFDSCSFSSIKFPDSLESIPDWLFSNKQEIKSVEFGNGLKSIGTNSFYGTSITSIKLPDSLEHIANSAFAGCEKLKQVEFGKNLKTMGKWAFNRSGLESVELPDSLEVIDENTFSYCKSLKHVEFGKNLKEIKTEAFQTSGVENLKFPNSLRVIDKYAFSYCSGLKNVELNEGVTQIWDRAFYMCNISKLFLPKSLDVNKMAFDSNSIRSILFRSREQMNAFKLNFIEEIVVGGDIKTVSLDMFNNFKYSYLKSLVLEDGVEKLGNWALGTIRLNNLVLPKNIKELNISAFVNQKNIPKLEVPIYGTLTFDEMPVIIDNISFKITDSSKINFMLDESMDFVNSQFNVEQKQKFVNWMMKQCSCSFYHDGARNVHKAFDKLFNKEVKFVPSMDVLNNLPAEVFDRFYTNGNDIRWGKLVKAFELDKVDIRDERDCIRDILALYCCLGGFSADEGVSNKAFQFLTKKMIPCLKVFTYSPATEIHRMYGGVKIENEHNPMFAGFVMKFFNNNPYFLSRDEVDYFSIVHNNFKNIQAMYPYMGITGNERNSLFTPEFLMDNCLFAKYKNVEPEDMQFAEIIGRYGFSQHAFDEMKKVYHYAQKNKENFIIKADKDNSEDPVRYNFLKKDDPTGFVIGKITNCCQFYGGAGESCVLDGYVNPNAGFLVFESILKDENGNPKVKVNGKGEPILDEDGNVMYEKRILGQAYVWYDEDSKTICYDNIEVPTKVLEEFKRSEKSSIGLKVQDLLDAVKRSAEAVMDTMNADGEVRVKEVTTGEGWNDLVSQFRDFKRKTSDLATHDRQLFIDGNGDVAVGSGYSDANNAQYIIRSYEEHTDNLSTSIKSSIDEGKSICTNTLARTAGRAGA